MAEITQIDLGLVVGDTGATGATGPTGPQGPGATISVGSVTTTTYGNPAQVTNSGTATDAVLDFVIPQGAPGEEVTDVSSLTLNSITETAASFPVPAVGDVMSVVMGKVKKFFADTVAALNTKLNKSNVVNDLTYTTEGYALDARAGKTLKTQLDSLSDSLSNVTSTGLINGFRTVVISSTSDVRITPVTGSFISIIALGFAQGIGSVSLLISGSGSNLSVKNLVTGSDFTNSALTFTLDGSTIIISSTYTSSSRLTLLIGSGVIQH